MSPCCPGVWKLSEGQWRLHHQWTGWPDMQIGRGPERVGVQILCGAWLTAQSTSWWWGSVLKMSMGTSVSSSAQALSTRPGMLSGPAALRALILERDLLTLAGDRDSTLSTGGGGVFCAGVLSSASNRPKKLFRLFSKMMSLSQVCDWGL